MEMETTKVELEFCPNAEREDAGRCRLLFNEAQPDQGIIAANVRYFLLAGYPGPVGGISIVVAIEYVNFFVWAKDICLRSNPNPNFDLVSGQKRFECLNVILFDQQIAHTAKVSLSVPL